MNNAIPLDRAAIDKAIKRALDLKTSALQDLAIVVIHVLERSSKPSVQARLAMPWIIQARDCGYSWKELMDALSPIFPSYTADTISSRVSQINGRCADKDYSNKQRRLAEAAGVDLPDSVDDGPVDPTQRAYLRVITKLVEERTGTPRQSRMQIRETPVSKPAMSSVAGRETGQTPVGPTMPKPPVVVPKSRFTDPTPQKKTYAQLQAETDRQVAEEREAEFQSRLKISQAGEHE
jgi:hypothetical protein